MSFWVQYHNCDALERYPSDRFAYKEVPIEDIILDNESEISSIYTSKKKQAYESIENEVFLIAGLGRPKKYFLWSKINPAQVFITEDGYYEVEGPTLYPPKPIRVDTIPEFDKFLKFCGNFGIGFQNITNHSFTNTLNTLLNAFDSTLENEIEAADSLHSMNEKMKNIYPDKRIQIVEKLIRSDAKIIKLLKEKYNYTCQYPGCMTKIEKKDGGFYIEVAHIKPVAKGGQSVIGNLLVLCPNHHKLFDYGNLVISEQTETILKGLLNNEPFEIK